MPDNPAVAAALAPEQNWKTAYPFIEGQARTILDALVPPDLVLSTTTLADRIYSPDEAHDPRVRKRVFQALKALSTKGLRAYVSLADVETIGNRSGQRRLWHRADPAAAPAPLCCPTCKRPL